MSFTPYEGTTGPRPIIPILVHVARKDRTERGESTIREDDTEDEEPGFSAEDPTFQYPTSYVRNTLFRVIPARPSSLRPSSSTREPAQRVRSPAPPPAQRVSEISPGVLSDGTFTVCHPHVDRYIDGLTRAYRKVNGAPPNYWHVQSLSARRLGEVSRVNALLDIGTELDETHCECVLALAALKLYTQATHPAHLALWGRPMDQRTIDLVCKLLYRKRQLIVSPVGWSGPDQMTVQLYWRQADAFPAQHDAHPATQAYLRKLKKKAAEAERAAAREAAQAERAAAREAAKAAAAAQPKKAPRARARAPRTKNTASRGNARAVNVVAAPAADETSEVDVITVEASRTAPARRPARQSTTRGKTAAPVPSSSSATPPIAGPKEAPQKRTIVIPARANRTDRRGSSTAVEEASTGKHDDEEKVQMITRSRKRKAAEADQDDAEVQTSHAGDAEARPTKRARRPSAKSRTR
ncbi:hypothetical protein POSPLADRAFT_1053332 [Postia placenta MAD-698-R-SB12]|uniref:Uncharacterized protein n=1 Tax=Postia placenta MAD-698-R-SB12 TaxID=670580 RepID=A0A1X6NDX5_9APHY|nr:hypothetical protein POSPLADRAFT_1053332 [Postia placenta MAD-698-R-SB12]OSX66712.1 hypothetical protein POSPLADRAFT_1053332 [Postia placenta MAD-698-R-SB12]